MLGDHPQMALNQIQVSEILYFTQIPILYIYILVGGLDIGTFGFFFPSYWECHNPN